MDFLHKLTDLRSELASLLDAWDKMIYDVKPQLEFMYDTIFGEIEDEIEQKTRILDEIDRKSAYFKPINNCKAQEERPKNSKDGSSSIKGHGGEYSSTGDITAIYRLLVKHLHPDVAGNKHLSEKYWNSVQQAYRNHDLWRLHAFKEVLASEISPESTEETLQQEMEILEANIEKQRREIARLKSEEPFSFRDRLNDEVWIRRRRKILEDRREWIDHRINLRTRHLEHSNALA